MSQQNKMNVDLIIEARWIVPVVPKNQYLENAAVAVHQGKIVAIDAADLVP